MLIRLSCHELLQLILFYNQDQIYLRIATNEYQLTNVLAENKNYITQLSIALSVSEIRPIWAMPDCITQVSAGDLFIRIQTIINSK